MAAKKKPAKKGELWKEIKPPSFTPFVQPTRPPANLYDPALDAAERAAGRGYGDLLSDTDTANARAGEDYGYGVSEIGRQRDEGMADLGRQRGYEGEDYTRAVGDLRRNYQRVARGQAETARATGNRGGALLQSLRKRTENEAYDRQPIDTQHTRFGVESGVQETRLGEGATRALGELSKDYERGVTDRGTALARGGRENAFFGTDTSQQRWYQALQSGQPLPAAPDNERQKYGVTFQVQNPAATLAKRTYALPSGQTYNRKQWVDYLGKRKAAGSPQMLYG